MFAFSWDILFSRYPHSPIRPFHLTQAPHEPRIAMVHEPLLPPESVVWSVEPVIVDCASLYQDERCSKSLTWLYARVVYSKEMKKDARKCLGLQLAICRYDPPPPNDNGRNRAHMNFFIPSSSIINSTHSLCYHISYHASSGRANRGGTKYNEWRASPYKGLSFLQVPAVRFPYNPTKNYTAGGCLEILYAGKTLGWDHIFRAHVFMYSQGMLQASSFPIPIPIPDTLKCHRGKRKRNIRKLYKLTLEFCP